MRLRLTFTIALNDGDQTISEISASITGIGVMCATWLLSLRSGEQAGPLNLK